MGSIASASISSTNPISVGTIYIEGQLRGSLGVYSYLVASGVLSSAIDIDLADDVTIYPNPTTGTFEIKSIQTDIKNIHLLDASGRYILSLDNQKTGDISHLASGIYFVQINER